MATGGVPLWSKTAASNASADPAVNWAEGQAPSSVNDSARGMMASVAKWRDDLYGLTTGGTSTAYTVTTNATYATAAEMSGAVFTIIPDNTSGASPTLAVDGLTARALNVSTGVAVPTGALVAGTPYLVKYVHATTEFIVLGSPGKSLLTALDIINGTSETSIATGDTLPIYDASATANRRMLVSDFLKIINALTEDTTPDSAADYVMSYDTSGTAAKKILLANMPSRLPRGYIDGCVLSNGTDATNDINIAAGVCRDSTNAVDITVPAISGKQLDANWAAGGAAGMRNSGAGITDTTYHIYAVRTAASATADIYAHTSTTVATVLTALQAETGGSDYVYARRIGSIVRLSNAIVPFIQVGEQFVLSPPLNVTVSTAFDNTQRNYALPIPTGLSLLADVYVWGEVSGTLASIVVGHPSVTFASPTNTSGSPTAVGSGVSNVASLPAQTRHLCRTDTSAQIAVRANAECTDWDIYVFGWMDQRGRDA